MHVKISPKFAVWLDELADESHEVLVALWHEVERDVQTSPKPIRSAPTVEEKDSSIPQRVRFSFD